MYWKIINDVFDCLETFYYEYFLDTSDLNVYLTLDNIKSTSCFERIIKPRRDR